jgi:hypothetical protein
MMILLSIGKNYSSCTYILRFAPAKMGGLYMTLLNQNRDEISQLDNIHLLGLIHNEADFMTIMTEVVDELEVLNNAHRIQTRFGDVKTRTFLGLFLADTPQRNVACNIMGVTANRQCKDCLCSKKNHRCNLQYKSNGTLNAHGKTFTTRTVPEMRKYFNKWLKEDNATRKKLEKKYGLNPTVVNGQYQENPFFKLYDLYGFDIYTDSPVDFFHVEIIGLIQEHVELFHNDLPEKQKQEFEQHYSTYKYHNYTLKPWHTRNYWMGDECK